MPSGMNLPNTTALITAFQAGVRASPGGKPNNADVRTGSRYDVWGGVNAILSKRIAARAKGIFAQNYFSSASGDSLDLYISRRFNSQFPRIGAAYGTGVAALVRTGTSATTILDGTRISITIPGTDSQIWAVINGDVSIGAGALSVPVAIRTATMGASAAFSLAAGDGQLKIEDPLDDSTWAVQSVTCGAGADREKDAAYRARVLTTLDNTRLGYETAIVTAMKAAGAANVQFFDSRWPYDDSSYAPTVGATQIDNGLNKVVVSDAGGGSTPALIRACQFALDAVACGGINAQAYGQIVQPLSFTVLVTMWSQVSTMDQSAIRAAIQARIVAYMQTHGVYWRLVGVAAAAQQDAKDAQSVAVTCSESEPAMTNLFSSGVVKLYTVTDTAPLVTFATG